MPGKFVFPGGRSEPGDRHMPRSGELGDRTDSALAARNVRVVQSRGRALALTAIRETYEETGLMLGRAADTVPSVPAGEAWAAFATHRVLPDLSDLHFIGRAITPPGRPRRFDTRFFSADREMVAWSTEGFVGPDKELVELVWVEFTAARRLDLPAITLVMIGELETRIAQGFTHDLPVPFFYERHGRFRREEL